MRIIDCNTVSRENPLNDGDCCCLNCINESTNKNYNVFVNGMISDSPYVVDLLKSLENSEEKVNVENILIYNESSYNRKEKAISINNIKSFFTDLYNCILGKISNKLGNKSEKSVESVINFILNNLENDSKIVLNAYSQGSIIVGNAINILKELLSKDEWNMLSKQVSINLYGSATSNFPSDIKINEWQTSFDIVTFFQGLNIKKFKNDNYKIHIIDDIGHSFNHYQEEIKNNKLF